MKNRTKIDLVRLLELEDLVNLTGGIKVKAGILEGATNNETGESVAAYAAYNEYGTADIPSRPFMRKTFDKKEGTWFKGLGNAIRNGRSPEDAMKLLGMRMADDIVETIASNMPPPNSPETIASKTKKVVGKGAKTGESHVPGTLIDTGSMIASVNYEVSR